MLPDDEGGMCSPGKAMNPDIGSRAWASGSQKMPRYHSDQASWDQKAAAYLVTSSGLHREPRAEPGPEPRTPGAVLSRLRIQTEAGCPHQGASLQTKSSPGGAESSLRCEI